MTKIRESASYSRVPPTRILLGEAHNELGDLDHDARTTGPFAPRAGVPLFGNQPSVPREQGVGRDDTGDFGQEFPAEGLTLYCEPASLVVREAKLPPAKPSFEDSVLLEQVDDSGLLLALNPTSDGDDQQCQGLDRRAHDRGF